MKRLTYLSVAELELAEAAQYYDAKEPGLGKTFLDAVHEAETRIRQNPEAWAYHARPIRCYRARPFPHRILYRELPGRIQVVAIAHPSQRPGYWKKR